MAASEVAAPRDNRPQCVTLGFDHGIGLPPRRLTAEAGHSFARSRGGQASYSGATCDGGTTNCSGVTRWRAPCVCSTGDSHDPRGSSAPMVGGGGAPRGTSYERHRKNPGNDVPRPLGARPRSSILQSGVGAVDVAGSDTGGRSRTASADRRASRCTRCACPGPARPHSLLVARVPAVGGGAQVG